MEEQHHPSHEPQGTDHQGEEQRQLARDAPETHEPPASQAAAEPQSPPAVAAEPQQPAPAAAEPQPAPAAAAPPPDRKSTRLNSSHMSISYAVFCLKKKKKQLKTSCLKKKKKKKKTKKKNKKKK